MGSNLIVLKKFQGPNRYHLKPVIQATHDLPRVADKDLPALARRMADLLNRECPSHVVQNLRKLPPFNEEWHPRNATDLVAWTAIHFQRWAGMPVVFHKTITDEASGKSNELIFEHRLSSVALAAGLLSCRLITILLKSSQGSSIEDAHVAIKKFIDNHTYVLGTSIFIHLAEKRGIPWSITTQDAKPLSLGQGRYRKRVILSFTDATSYISTILSSNKLKTASILRAQGLPAPQQYIARTEDEAAQSANKIGFPVVVKPRASDYGNGVSTNLNTTEDVRRAYVFAARFGDVIIENHLPGDSHRISVINGKIHSVRRLIAAHVMGDGIHSINQLVEKTNFERAHVVSDVYLKPIFLNEETQFLLARQNFTTESIPSKGQRIQLKSQSNRSAGGSVELVTDITHPDNFRLAVRASALLGIDIAGLDFMTPDISKSYLEIGGGFCELNVNPGLILGEEETILEDWFPQGSDGRIVTIGLLDDDGSLAPRIAERLRAKHPNFTWASRNGFYSAGQLATKGAHDNEVGMHRACNEPGTTAALMELNSDDMFKNGLGLDKFDLIITRSEQLSQTRANTEWAQGLLKTISKTMLTDLPDADILREIDQFLSSTSEPA